MPMRTSRIGLLLLPTSRMTRLVAMSAPRNAPNDTAYAPIMENMPSTIAHAAPAPAPEDTPRMYGSASALRVMVCMASPTSASPAPVQIANSVRGRRMFHSTTPSVPGALMLPYMSSCRIVSTGIGTAPKPSERMRLAQSTNSR